jgi:hypothetical protein
MSNPFAVNPGGVIQDPGTGSAIAGGIASVLAAQQAQQEQQYRLQQLALQQQQQAALAQYYQGQVANQQAEQQRLTTRDQAEQRARAQAGGAMQRAVGMGQPSMATQQTSMAPGAMPGQPVAGNPLQEALEGGAAATGGAQGLSAIFGNVDPENMGAAVEGVQQVQQLAPKPEALPTSAQEMEYLKRLASRDPAQAKLYYDTFLAPKGPQTVINNVSGEGETEFSKQLAKSQVEMLSKGENEARQAASSFPQIDQAYKLVDKAFTGFGANAVLNLARAANVALPDGYKVGADKVRDSQLVVKLLRDQTLSYLQTRALGSGTAVSDKDREFMERQSGADLALEGSSIKRIIRINVGTALMRTTEAIQDLRDQAIAYPKNAQQLNAKAANLQRKHDVMWKRYSEMLQDEEAGTSNLRNKLNKIPGLQLPGGQ